MDSSEGESGNNPQQPAEDVSTLEAVFGKKGDKEGWFNVENPPKDAEMRSWREVVPGLEAVINLFKRKFGKRNLENVVPKLEPQTNLSSKLEPLK